MRKTVLLLIGSVLLASTLSGCCDPYWRGGYGGGYYHGGGYYRGGGYGGPYHYGYGGAYDYRR